MMLVHKLMIAAGLLLAVGLLGTSATMRGRAVPLAGPLVSDAPADRQPLEAGAEGGAPREVRLPTAAVARMGTTGLRHGDGIFFASYTPDGKAMLTAGKDRTIRLWDLATGKELRRFDRGPAADEPEAPAPEPTGAPDKEMDRRMLATLAMDFQVALSPDGRTVAASRASTVRLWETATGKLRHELKTGQTAVTMLAFSTGGESLLALGPDLSVSVWKVATGKCRKRTGGQRGKRKEEEGRLATVSPRLKYLAWQHVDPASQSSTVKLRDLTTGKDLPSLKVPLGGAFGLAFAPDEKTLACSGFLGGIVLSDVATGKEVRRLGGGLGEPVTALAFSPDGKSLAASRANLTVELWDLQTGKRARRIGEPITETNGMAILVRGMGAMARSALAFAPDGKKLVACLGGAVVRQFDVATGAEVAPPAGGHRATIAAVGLSATGTSLLTYGPGDPVRHWDLATGRQMRQVAVPGKTTAVAFSAGGRFATAADATVTLHEADGKEVRKVQAGKFPVLALALSPDGTVLATRTVLSPEVRLWDLTTGKERATLGQGGDTAKGTGIVVAETVGVLRPDLVFSADGRFLVGAGSKRQLCLWDAGTGTLLWEVAPATGQAIERFAFSGNGRCLAALNADSTVTLYETLTGEARCRLGRPDPKTGAAGLTVSVGGLSLALADRRDAPVCLGFSPDGRFLATAKDTPDIRLWDVLAGKEVGRLTGHQGGVVSLLFTPDGKRLVSGSTDTTALTWDVDRWTHRRPAPQADPDGATLDRLWQDLASADAAKSFAALRELAASPARAAALVGERVRPVAPADPKRLARLVSDLDSDRFDVRQKAEAGLEGFGERAAPLLRQVLRDEPPLVLRQRVDRLLRKLSGPTPSGGLVRDLRAVELLELAGGAESRQVLEALARGAADARLTREAKAAAARLAKRAVIAP